jgi:putative hemolysin
MSKRIPITIGVVLLALILAACGAPSTPAPQPTATKVPTVNTPAMGEAEAKQIAAQTSECTQAGTLQDTATYNPNSATWWIDIKADKPGCSPACVVNAVTKQAAVNWRCTGAGVPPTNTSKPTGGQMANPASENCTKQGGQLVIQTLGDGGQYGVCLFEDNRQCEEWALLHGDCPVGGLKITGYTTPAAQYCAITGGTYAITSGGNTANETGTCTFKDGTTCDVNDYYNGKCAPGSTPAAPATPISAAIQPLPVEVCNGEAQAMAHTLNITEVTQSNVPLTDPTNGKSGTGCQSLVTGTGTGQQFQSPDAVIKSLDAMLKDEGWTEDQMLASGGPTGMGSGYRKDNQLCLDAAIWQPDASANCPKDQPISACKVTPEQQLYTITLNCGVETP